MRDQRKKKQTGETMRMLFLVTQIGLCMISALAVGGLLGYGADRLFHASPVFTIIGLFVGIAAGFSSTWSLVRRYAEDPEQDEAKPVDAKQAEADAEFLRWKQRKAESEETENPGNGQ